MRFPLPLTRASAKFGALIILGAFAVPATAFGAPTPQRARPPVTPVGSLVQLPGRSGCLVDRSKRRAGCALVRALRGPAPFLGSDAVAISPDGKNVYVASSKSNAIAVFRRNASTGKLTQGSGTAGCIAAGGAGGCAKGLGLDGPNSVAVSADGNSVYATSLTSNAVAILRRNRSTGALTQARNGGGCIANSPTTGCATGRALDGPDVVAVSPDGRNVYVGSFKGNALAVFSRRRSTGALSQPAGTTGCITNTPISGCSTGLALAAPEGMALSGDGEEVYVAAAVSNALDVLARKPSTGALTQATNGTGCIVESALAGCATGAQLGGADAVAVSHNDADVYVTSLLSNSVTAFTRTPSTGQLTQQAGTSACVIYLLAVGCSLGRTLSAPEGLAVSPDDTNVYAAAFGSGAIDVFNRNANSGAVTQKPRAPGCVVSRATPDCTHGRALLGVSSLAVSPDGRYAYSAAFASNAVDVFKRVTRATGRGRG
jgi:DNA-binding beta-propeller fold protein YncE